MMKKFLKKIQLALITLIILAQPAIAVSTDYLLPAPKDIIHVKNYEELDAIAGLPDVTTEGAVATIIKTILGLAMMITIVGIVVAAYFYLAFEGEDEKIDKAKSTILYLIIGMAIMAAAYAIVTGVIQFDFFQ